MPKLWKLDTNGCHRTIDCSPSVWILQTRITACLRIYERFTETLVSQWYLTPNNLVVWERVIGPLMSFVHEGCILFYRLCPELPGVRMLSEPVYLQGRGEDEHVSMAYLWYGFEAGNRQVINCD